MSVQLTSYGAALEVTGSKHCLDVDGYKILVDCGIFQGILTIFLRNSFDLPWEF